MKKNSANESLIRAGFSLIIAFALFNALNFFYHFFSARMLGPAEYGVVASLFSIIYLISMGSTAIQNAITKFTSGFKAKKEDGKIAYLFKRGMKKLLGFSIIAFVLYLIISPLIASFLKIPLLSVLILSPVIILSVLIPLNRGLLQGMQKFNALGINMVIEGSVKLAFALLLIYLGFKANGAIFAVSIAMTIAFLSTFPLLKFSSKKKTKFDSKEIYSFSYVTFIALFLITAIYNIDIFLVKHFFSAESAGHYAAVSLLGKIVFFSAYALGLVMLPKVAEMQKREKQKKIFIKALAFTFLIALPIALVYFLFPKLLVSLIFGPAYSEVSNLLGMFGISMLLLSLSYICTLYKLAIGKKKFIWIIAAAVLLEAVMIVLFHNSLQQIVYILAILNALLFAILIGK